MDGEVEGDELGEDDSSRLDLRILRSPEETTTDRETTDHGLVVYPAAKGVIVEVEKSFVGGPVC